MANVIEPRTHESRLNPRRRHATAPTPALRQVDPTQAQRKSGQWKSGQSNQGQSNQGEPRPAKSLLPEPPDDAEKYGYIKRHAWVLSIFSAISFAGFVISQMLMVRATPLLWAYVPFLAFTILYYLISLVMSLFTRDFDLDAHRDLVHSWRPLEYPSVDVLLPVCGEPADVLRNTWTKVAALRKHYHGPVLVYVLDDSADPALRAMAAEFGFRYGVRPNRGWFKKAGNLHYGIRISHGDYVLLLDADFAPRADLLDEMLPYFEADPKIGIVQSPQYFHILDHQTWVERGAGAVQELFYRSVQTSLAEHDGAICVGSCAVYRRAALEENGGMTLIEHSEDIHTGFDLRRLGWTLKYIPVALSTGVCPDNIPAFLNQQYRWCSGTMSLLGSRKLRQSDVPLSTRLCLLPGFIYYIHTALFVFLVPVVPIVLLMVQPGRLQLQDMLMILPGLVYSGLVFPMWHKCPYRLEAFAVRTIFGWAHVFTIWDVLRKKRMGWHPSGAGAKKQRGTRRFWIGLIGWSGGTALVWVGLAFWRMMTMDPMNFVILMASGLFYAVVVGRVMIQPRIRDEA